MALFYGYDYYMAQMGYGIITAMIFIDIHILVVFYMSSEHSPVVCMSQP